ncbi:MAG: hypothetical protein IKO27_09525 [Ruminococcus sp.]|nr:hypothetical protein [Ruminococcus sp.]
MKLLKPFTIFTASICILASCGSTDSSRSEPADTDTRSTAEAVESAAPIDDSSTEVIQSEVDCIHYSFDELIKNSEVVMIGEYTDDGKPNVSYLDPDEKTRPYGAYTIRKVKVGQVFKGEDKVKAGDTKSVVEGYAFITASDGKKQLLISSELAPMKKGDKAVFVMKYNKSFNAYDPFGSQGRFPLPEDRGKTDEFGFTDGLAKGVSFQGEIYDALRKKFGF